MGFKNRDIIFSETEPKFSSPDYARKDTLWFNPTTAEMRRCLSAKPDGLEWEMLDNYVVLPSKDGLTGTTEGSISKIKVSGGYVNEVETESEAVTGVFSGAITKLSIRNGLVVGVEIE